MAGRIVVGDDGSEHAEAAVRYAIEQARARHTELHVVHSRQMPAFSPHAVAYDGLVERIMQDEINAARERVILWREQHPDLLITDEQVCDHPVSALVEASGTADLVVVGSRGLGGFASAVLGSVGHGVRGRAPHAVPVRSRTCHPSRHRSSMSGDVVRCWG
jgi:nucleotide-binding universal stress UspA family protein